MIEVKTKVKNALGIKTKLSLLLIAATALSFSVTSFAMLSVNFEKLKAKKNVPSSITKQVSNEVSGQVKDILTGEALSNVTATFTNSNDPGEIYNTVVDADGNYELVLGAAGEYDVYTNYNTVEYYGYQDSYLQINTFPFVYNVNLLQYEDYDMEANWDCSSEFNITPGDFPLITYMDGYYELLNIYINNGTLTQAEWDELIALKWGTINSIKSELQIINNDISNQLYVDGEYASILLDKTLCNYRTEIDFYYSLDHSAWPPVYPNELNPHSHISTNYWYDNDNRSILNTINEIIKANPSIVAQELFDNQAIEKIASILDWQIKFSSEGDKIKGRHPWTFWDDYAEHLRLDDMSWVHPSDAIYPNTQRRLMLFYTNGIDALLSMLVNIADNSDKELLNDSLKNNGIFAKNYKLMTLPSITDATMPAYRVHVIGRNLDLLNIMYPYVFRNENVQDIVAWNNENKNQNSHFWTYIATDKVFTHHDQEMIEISNLFNNFCTSTSTTGLNGVCSPIEKPLFCDNGNIVNNCQRCGCVSGAECHDRGYCYIDEIPAIHF